MPSKTSLEPEWADEKFVTARYGITHTPLFNLRKAEKIRSLSLKGEGQTYGKRLYHIPSIREFLAAQESRELVSTAKAATSPPHAPKAKP